MRKSNLFSTRTRWLISGLTMAALLLSACQAAQSTPKTASTAYPGAVNAAPTSAPVSAPGEVAPTTAPNMGGGEQPAPAAGATINVVNDPKYGPILVGEGGMTLYIFTNDTPDTSNCTGGCLTQWPPFKTVGTPVAGKGVDPSLIGTAKLADGSLIVTYNHMPLYYWFKDSKPGDTTGEGVGSVWFMISPAGALVK